MVLCRVNNNDAEQEWLTYLLLNLLGICKWLYFNTWLLPTVRDVARCFYLALGFSMPYFIWHVFYSLEVGDDRQKHLDG